MPQTPPAAVVEDRPPHSPTNAIRLIAMIAAGAAAYLTAPILVPFLLGMVLSIALAPLANRLERLGANRTISSLACMLLVAVAVATAGGLVSYQAGVMFKKGDVYLDRLGDVSARLIRSVGGESWIQSLARQEDAPPRAGAMSREAEGDALVARVRAEIRRNAGEIGRWAATGLNGLVGILGNMIVVLAFLFYLLQGRDAWILRLTHAASGLGMRPSSREFAKVGSEVNHYLAMLFLIAGSYTITISAAMWLIGVPQPLFWGILTAILELIPFFGPIVAGALTTLAALGAGGAWWQPLAVVGVFLIVGMVEGYVVTPLLYGKAVEIDPVTVLLGVMVFGFLLGPAGLALAMSLMIILRGILIITPDTPALDALADAEGAP